MKKIVWVIAVFLFLVSGGVSYAVNVNIQTGLNFNWWDSDDDHRGSQTYIPISIFAEQSNFSAKILTSFAHTYSDPSVGTSDSLSCIIDTKANLSYEIVDKFFADLVFGLDFNLPTGKTKLDKKEQGLVLDPDLVAISRFGEGFNINPTITLAKVWNNLAAGIGVGYLWRGEYDYSETVVNYNPGDILSLTGEVSYFFSPKWQGRLFSEIAQYGNDEVGSRDYYEEGEFFLVGIGSNYYQTNWDVMLTFQGIFRGKSRFQEEGRGLTSEDRDSYGDEWSADLAWKYHLSKETTLRSQLYYMYVMENDYASDSPFYIGDKRKISLAFAIARQFTPLLKGEFGLNGYILDEERNWWHTGDRTYNGFVASVIVTKMF
ncbi:MAG: hypothetical protein V2B19_29400 [Pseudomonadota bacterium]